MTTYLTVTAPCRRKSQVAKFHREEPLIPGLATCGRECTTRVLLADPEPATLCGHCWPGVAA